MSLQTMSSLRATQRRCKIPDIAEVINADGYVSTHAICGLLVISTYTRNLRFACDLWDGF